MTASHSVWQRIVGVLLTLVLSVWGTDSFGQTSVVSSPRIEAARYFDARTQGRTPAPVEGVWQTSDGVILAITRSGEATFDMKLFSCEDLSIPMPITVGEIRLGARPGLYDAHMARKIDNKGRSSRMTSLAITVSDNASWLEFASYKKGLSVNLYRLIPYMFRFSVRTVDTRPQGLQGARRLYPTPYPDADNPLVL